MNMLFLMNKTKDQISWSVLGKQNVQAKKVYYKYSRKFTPLMQLIIQSLSVLYKTYTETF